MQTPTPSVSSSNYPKTRRRGLQSCSHLSRAKDASLVTCILTLPVVAAAHH